jgi:hypothetical protein
MVMTRKRVPFSDLPGPINLGNPEEATILNIARKIIDFTGSKSDICPDLQWQGITWNGILHFV